MHSNYFFWLVFVALFCLILIFFSLWREIETPTAKEGIHPPLPPYKSYISGVGIAEPSSGSIKIGAPVSRLVEKLLVEVGDKVTKGQTLYKLDDRDFQASLFASKAAYDGALAKLQRLEKLPRKEDS